MLSVGAQSNVLLLGMPTKVFRAVALGLNQRWCLGVYMSFTTHPNTGSRYSLRDLRKPEQKRL